jgi:hypothetical protein
MAVIDGEVVYEGVMGGDYTYGVTGVWNINSNIQPYGLSPVGWVWNYMSWEEAYQLPGSKQLGLGKKCLMRYAWWRLGPHPEWVNPRWTKENYDLLYAAGFPGELRLVFVPETAAKQSLAIPSKIVGLESGVNYRAIWFCPRDGAEVKIGDVVPDAEASWEVPIVPTFEQWVVILEKNA